MQNCKEYLMLSTHKCLFLKYYMTSTFSNLIFNNLIGWFFFPSQEKLNSVAKSSIMARGSPAHCASPPLVTPAWQQLGPQRATHSNAVSPKHPLLQTAV